METQDASSRDWLESREQLLDILDLMARPRPEPGYSYRELKNAFDHDFGKIMAHFSEELKKAVAKGKEGDYVAARQSLVKLLRDERLDPLQRLHAAFLLMATRWVVAWVQAKTTNKTVREQTWMAWEGLWEYLKQGAWQISQNTLDDFSKTLPIPELAVLQDTVDYARARQAIGQRYSGLDARHHACESAEKAWNQLRENLTRLTIIQELDSETSQGYSLLQEWYPRWVAQVWGDYPQAYCQRLAGQVKAKKAREAREEAFRQLAQTLATAFRAAASLSTLRWPDDLGIAAECEDALAPLWLQRLCDLDELMKKEGLASVTLDAVEATWKAIQKDLQVRHELENGFGELMTALAKARVRDFRRCVHLWPRTSKGCIDDALSFLDKWGKICLETAWNQNGWYEKEKKHFEDLKALREGWLEKFAQKGIAEPAHLLTQALNDQEVDDLLWQIQENGVALLGPGARDDAADALILERVLAARESARFVWQKEVIDQATRQGSVFMREVAAWAERSEDMLRILAELAAHARSETEEEAAVQGEAATLEETVSPVAPQETPAPPQKEELEHEAVPKARPEAPEMREQSFGETKEKPRVSPAGTEADKKRLTDGDFWRGLLKQPLVLAMLVILLLAGGGYLGWQAVSGGGDKVNPQQGPVATKQSAQQTTEPQIESIAVVNAPKKVLAGVPITLTVSVKGHGLQGKSPRVAVLDSRKQQMQGACSAASLKQGEKSLWTASVTCTFPEPGKYTFTTSVAGQSSSTDISVEKPELKITLDDQPEWSETKEKQFRLPLKIESSNIPSSQTVTVRCILPAGQAKFVQTEGLQVDQDDRGVMTLSKLPASIPVSIQVRSESRPDKLTLSCRYQVKGGKGEWEMDSVSISPPAPVPMSIEVTPKSMELGPGMPITVTATVLDNFGQPMGDQKVTWTVGSDALTLPNPHSNPATVSVSEGIGAEKLGETTLSARIEDITSEPVTMEPVTVKIRPIARISNSERGYWNGPDIQPQYMKLGELSDLENVSLLVVGKYKYSGERWKRLWWQVKKMSDGLKVWIYGDNISLIPSGARDEVDSVNPPQWLAFSLEAGGEKIGYLPMKKGHSAQSQPETLQLWIPSTTIDPSNTTLQNLPAPLCWEAPSNKNSLDWDHQCGQLLKGAETLEFTPGGRSRGDWQQIKITVYTTVIGLEQKGD